MRPNDSQNDMYVVHSQTRTYHNGKEPNLQQKLVDISVMENMSGVHADITFSTEEGAWWTVTTPDSSWITPTLLTDVCCHVFLCRSGVHQTGLSVLHLSENRLCRVLQFEEARRESLPSLMCERLSNSCARFASTRTLCRSYNALGFFQCSLVVCSALHFSGRSSLGGGH